MYLSRSFLQGGTMRRENSKKKKSTLFKNSWIGLLSFVFVFKPTALFAQEVIDSTQDRIVVTTDIDSTVDEVWNVMIDFENYDRWNKWYRLEGEAKEDATIKAYGESGKHLDLKITKMDENTLCWVDVSWFTHFGLGGWRCRTVVANSDGNGVKFVNHFEYTGPLRSLLAFGTRKAVIEGMILENRSMKEFVER